jgi:choline-glycine betaine transporter
MRLLFRILLALTLVILFLGRVSGGKLLPAFILGPFLAWFGVSVFVFGVFGLRAAYLAWRDPANRRAYLFDIILAVAWIPYWYSNLHPRK